MEVDKTRGGDEDGVKESNGVEERMMPQDMDAFLKHPLVQGDNGDAIALLHEYQTLYPPYSNRAENSSNPLFGSNFIPKMSTCSNLESPHITQFVPDVDGSIKEENFYKSEYFGSRSMSNSLMNQNKLNINDPALPSINVLSRSTLAQNHFISSSPIKSINSHPLTDWKCSMNEKLKTNDPGFKFSPPIVSSGYESVNCKFGNSFLGCDETSALKPDKLPPLSFMNKNDSSAGVVDATSRIHFSTIQSSIGQSQQTQFTGTESSAIDMSFQGNVHNLKTINSNKFLTSKQFFGDNDLIQMLEKQIPQEQFTNSVNSDSQKLHPNIPSLPFPLPEVPLGYRLVITHLPITNDQEPDSKHITQLIIDNPIVPSNTNPLSQNSDNPMKLQINNLQSVVKALDVESGNLSTAKKFHIFHHPTMQSSNNKATNTKDDPLIIPKEYILKKSLEEANLLPLMDQNISNHDPTISPAMELSFFQKEINLSTWQGTSSNVSSANTINSQKTSSPIKRPSYKGKTNTRWNHISFIRKTEQDNSGFKFYLEAAISSSQRKDEDRVTYLNKSQYYGLVLQHNPTTQDFFCTSQTLKSVVMLVFRERMSDEMRAWECWYSRQHSYKQRVLDLDSKNSGINEGFSKPILIEEAAHNATAIFWHKHTSVKLNLALNCLSTDFSHQKGIRGNPLHVQIDTYDGDQTDQPIHRAYCQIKVFCDKGADRKIREEEKKRSNHFEDHEHQEPCDQSYFYSMFDLVTPPLLFTPSSSHFQTLDKKNSSIISGTKRHSSEQMDGSLDSKKQANDKLLLYAREETDAVFIALVVQPPTVECLAKSIQEKFLNPSIYVENIYKESKVMKVKVDDVIVSSISDESAFIISFQHHPQKSADNKTSCDVTLTEIRIQND